MSFTLAGCGEGSGLETRGGNLDVRIELEDGRVYAATFFTISNLSLLLERYRTTGECAGGSYVWAKDMVVVEIISEDVIRRSVADMIHTGEIEAACTRLK